MDSSKLGAWRHPSVARSSPSPKNPLKRAPGGPAVRIAFIRRGKIHPQPSCPCLQAHVAGFQAATATCSARGSEQEEPEGETRTRRGPGVDRLVRDAVRVALYQRESGCRQERSTVSPCTRAKSTWRKVEE